MNSTIITGSSEGISKVGEIGGDISLFISKTIQQIHIWISKFTIFEWLLILLVLFLALGLLYLRRIVKNMQSSKRNRWRNY